MGRVPVGEPDDDVLAYLTPEAKARVAIDRMLREAGWAVQDRTKANLAAARGVAIREFTLKPGHGEADYLLFVDGQAVGVIEAKKQGETLTGVAWQTGRYCAGLPDAVPTPFEGELAFLYQSTDVEARFTNGLDPEPRSRRVFWFHRPETPRAAGCSLDTLPARRSSLRSHLTGVAARRCASIRSQASAKTCATGRVMCSLLPAARI